MNHCEEIKKLKNEKNAIILAHYYQRKEIQDIADFVGDSLELSKKALNTNANIIVFAGVYFMAETAKILNPDKKVLIPDVDAGCSLADSCNHEDLKILKNKYPDYVVVSYINCTSEVKALSDIICTSSNAVKVVNSIPENKGIIFTPDKNLGNYIKSITKRDMIIWDGSCIVHEMYSTEKIIELKLLHPNAKVISHPECKQPVLNISDFIGSTSAMLKYTVESDSDEFIVATEPGIIYQMKKLSPNKKFYVPQIDDYCNCNDCKFMKLTTIEKIYNVLLNENNEVILNVELMEKARKPIMKMLEIK